MIIQDPLYFVSIFVLLHPGTKLEAVQRVELYEAVSIVICLPHAGGPMAFFNPDLLQNFWVFTFPMMILISYLVIASTKSCNC